MNKFLRNKFPLIAILVILFSTYAHAQPTASQHPDRTNEQWYFADPVKDKVPGISLYEAYRFLEGRQGTKVIVAVIDSGVDTAHQDLKPNLWVNTREISGNGIDDDGNGYIDDVHGWNFLGNSDGENVAGEALEKTRLYAQLHPIYGNRAAPQAHSSNYKEYQLYLQVRDSYLTEVKETENRLKAYKIFLTTYENVHKLLQGYFKGMPYTVEDVKKIKPNNDVSLEGAKSLYILYRLWDYTPEEIEGWITTTQSVMDTKLNLYHNPRVIIHDDPINLSDSLIGNNDLDGGTPGHGTSVAGLIAALRGNGLGIDGIADQAELMIIRVVPGGDERDKDVALAIRYAVNQGAKIINCSFGKEFSPEKELVDDAVKYAEERGVLIVHASGNEANDNDKNGNYPTPWYSNGTRASNWIEVGASTKDASRELVASFSNYGQKTVDLFAPGQDIVTLKPQGYSTSSGTSLASPVVSGVAALLLSYYPKLTPHQVREILISSVTPYGRKKVNLPGSDKRVKMKTLSLSGGVLNAANAVKMADRFVNEGR